MGVAAEPKETVKTYIQFDKVVNMLYAAASYTRQFQGGFVTVRLSTRPQKLVMLGLTFFYVVGIRYISRRLESKAWGHDGKTDGTRDEILGALELKPPFDGENN